MYVLLMLFGLSFYVQAHIMPSAPLPNTQSVEEGPYYKIYKPEHPLVETHLLAFPMDEWGLPYRDIKDYNNRTSPQEKLRFVRAIAARAEAEGIVKQGYRILANSDDTHPYLKMYSPYLEHGKVDTQTWSNMIVESHTPAFCFHIVSDPNSLSTTTLTPKMVQNQEQKRKRNSGYQDEQKYKDCDIARVARGEQKGTLYRSGQHFTSIKDIHPKANFHGLVVAREAYFSHYELCKYANADTIQELFDMIVHLGSKTETKSFRITSNHGLVAHQSQPVVHFHVVGDEPLGAMCYPYDMYYNELSASSNMPQTAQTKKALKRKTNKGS